MNRYNRRQVVSDHVKIGAAILFLGLMAFVGGWILSEPDADADPVQLHLAPTSTADSDGKPDTVAIVKSMKANQPKLRGSHVD